MFAQGDGSRHDNRKCFQCGKKGHMATHCPAEKPGANINDKDESDHLNTMQAVESELLEISGGENSWNDNWRMWTETMMPVASFTSKA